MRLVAALLILACAPAGAAAPLGPPPGFAYETGDLLLRAGTDLDSDLILAATHGAYTHVGVVVAREGEAPLVVQASRNEGEGIPDGVSAVTPGEFFSPQRARRGLALRLGGPWPPGAREALRGYLLGMLGQGFSLREGGLYCTTLAEGALIAAGATPGLPRDRLTVPLLGGDYLLPGRFLTLPGAAILFSFGR
ncbi:MAG: hypothetical protein K6A65_06325 [Succinivibrionaceae bacterium]|nr:hypothetical protein [Succinivibrionaceae bacterium]